MGDARSAIRVIIADDEELARRAIRALLEPYRDVEVVAEAANGIEAVEVIDRVVLASTNPDGVPSARVFRHKGLVLLVEGERADQLDAVVSAWINDLGPG